MTSLPMVGEEVAGYRLRAVLGRGGMSVVYQAENLRLGSVIALKVMTPELAANDVFRARFLQESRIAASLNHPNVIPIYDMGVHEDLLYIAMRYVNGADLRAVLKEQGHITPSQTLPLVGQAARALDAAHRHGLVHRDVKPANILIERSGDGEPDHVYLADFGITKHALSRSGLTATGEFIGTADYMAPEQIQGRRIDARTDVYSLGCVLYECLTGQVPFVKDLDAAVIWAHVEEPPAPPSMLRPELPAALDDVIACALAKDPDERYPTCRDLTEAARSVLGPARGPATVLSAYQPHPGAAPRDQFRYPPAVRFPAPSGVGVPPQAPPAQPPPPPGRHRRGNRLAAFAAGALGVLIIGGAGLWALHRPGPAPAPMPGRESMSTPLLRSVAAANQTPEAKGTLPPRSCHAQGKSSVTCTNPTVAVESVTFTTYPSLKALYTAYVAELRSLGDRRPVTNFGNCSGDQTSGEIAWNHNFRHPRHVSLPAMKAGMVSDNVAAGRVFCTFTNAGYQMVWTQDPGYLLGVMLGGSHQDAYGWWVKVHHNLAAPGTKPMHM